MAALTVNVVPAKKQLLRVETVDVTPEIAQEWLGRNTRNRRLKARSIQNYARDMKAGNWRLTGEAIKFDTNGVMLDGQNRAHAVIQADCTVRMLVIWNLPSSSQDVMDGGARRTNSDQLGLHDIPNATAVAAIASAWAGWQAGTWTHAASMASAPQLTHAETLQLVDDHPEFIDAARVSQRVFKTLRLPVGVIGAAYVITSEIDPSDADDFFNRIADMQTSGSGDPIAALLKKVQGDSRTEPGQARKRIARHGEAFYLIFRTWNAWRSKDSLTNLRTRNQLQKSIRVPEPK